MTNLVEITLTIRDDQINDPAIANACAIASSYTTTPVWDINRCDITKGWVRLGTLDEIKNCKKGHEMRSQGVYAVTLNRGGISPFHECAEYIGQSERTVYERLKVFEAALNGQSNNQHRAADVKAAWEAKNGRTITSQDLVAWYRLHSVDGCPTLSKKNSTIVESMAIAAQYVVQNKFPTGNQQSLQKPTQYISLVRTQLTNAGWA